MEAIDLKALRKNMFGIPTSKKNICRSLFGEVDHEQVKRDLEKEFKETLQQKSMLWNFDFDKYCPRNDENSNGLQWEPEIAPVSSYTIKSDNSLVTSFSNQPLFKSKNQTSCPLKTSPTKKHSNTENKQTSITDFTQKIKTKNMTLSTSDDEMNSIEIINESPTRTIRRSPTTETYNAAVKLNLCDQEEVVERQPMANCGKRKRTSQLTIDGKLLISNPCIFLHNNLRTY